MCFRCHLHGIKLCKHPSVALFAASFACNMKLAYCKGRICGSLILGLRVGPLSSMLQLFPPLGWPRQSASDAVMQINSVHLGSLFCIQGGRLCRAGRTIQATLLCNHPPLVFGAWAVNGHGYFSWGMQSLLTVSPYCLVLCYPWLWSRCVWLTEGMPLRPSAACFWEQERGICLELLERWWPIVCGSWCGRSDDQIWD